MLLETHTNNVREWSDEEVFVRSMREPEFYGEVVDRYQKAFFRKAREILKDEDDAYDAVQEAFVRMYASAKKYRVQQDVAFKSWAYKVLVNQCYTMYQKNKKEQSRRIAASDADIDIPDQNDLDIYDQKLTKDYVMSLVSRLPALLAKTVSMYFIDGVSQKEIAHAEGVSPEAIRVRIHRAKKELQQIALHI